MRLVQEHTAEHGSQWAAIAAIAPKVGCTTETLRHWVRQAGRDAGQRAGLTTDERARLKALEREVIELKRANEILRKAAAFFAQAELEPPTGMMVAFIDQHRETYGVADRRLSGAPPHQHSRQRGWPYWSDDALFGTAQVQEEFESLIDAREF